MFQSPSPRLFSPYVHFFLPRFRRQHQPPSPHLFLIRHHPQGKWQGEDRERGRLAVERWHLPINYKRVAMEMRITEINLWLPVRRIDKAAGRRGKPYGTREKKKIGWHLYLRVCARAHTHGACWCVQPSPTNKVNYCFHYWIGLEGRAGLGDPERHGPQL